MMSLLLLLLFYYSRTTARILLSVHHNMSYLMLYPCIQWNMYLKYDRHKTQHGLASQLMPVIFC